MSKAEQSHELNASLAAVDSTPTIDALSRIKRQKLELLSQLRELETREAALERHVAGFEASTDVKTAGAGEQLGHENGVKDTGDVEAAGGGANGASQAFPALGFVGSCKMSAAEVQRYSRQMLLPSFGIEAQERLRQSSVLVIGAGGLGCPIALYLTGAGVGRLGIVDRDTVESSNLHRQVIHTEARVGQHKVDSAAQACRDLNSHVSLDLHRDGFTPANALSLVDRYDVVVDASDNVTTRYLINDAAVVANKPLVFGAALGVEGQVTVYHHKDGPCYRCLFPEPPPAAACQRCSEAGVLGVVPGVVGLLQAVEAVKLASGVGEALSARMVHYDALSARFLQVKLRGRSKGCAVCGDDPKISRSTLATYPYESFTSSPFHDKGPSALQLLPQSKQVSPHQLMSRLSAELAPQQAKPLILDVRPNKLFALGSIPGSMGIPLSELKDKISDVKAAVAEKALGEPGKAVVIVTVCRKGNDSQRAAKLLSDEGFRDVLSLRGGLHAWASAIDANFPVL